MLALGLALFLHLTEPVATFAPAHHKRHIHASAKRTSPADAALARRVARMTRLAMLVQREALLRDFLATTQTETPVLIQAESRIVASVRISNTVVSIDFLGMPLIHVRVHNERDAALSFEIVADIKDARGAQARAATVLTLAGGEARSVELACPARLMPASVVWSIVQL